MLKGRALSYKDRKTDWKYRNEARKILIEIEDERYIESLKDKRTPEQIGLMFVRGVGWVKKIDDDVHRLLSINTMKDK